MYVSKINELSYENLVFNCNDDKIFALKLPGIRS